MNIGIVIPWFPSAHVKTSFFGIFHYHQAKKLVEMGHKVVVMASHHKGMPKSETLDGILIQRFSSLTVPKIRYDTPNLVRLTSFISEMAVVHDLNIIEFFSSDYITSVPILFIRKRVKFPVVVVVNGLPGISWLTHNRLIDSAGWVYTNLIGKRLIKFADGVRVLNEGLYVNLLKFGVNKRVMQAIHFGVNVNMFRPCHNPVIRAESGLNADDFVVLFVGRLVRPMEMKGMSFLIKAAKELLPCHKNMKLIFVGDGDARYEVEGLTKSIKPNVRFVGFRRDVNNFMAAADVLVLPSLAEGCPNVVLEACASGIPVVASRVGAVPELIVDGETGFIFTPGDVGELKDALVKLITNPSLRQQMGVGARNRMVNEFTWDAICKKLVKFYQQIIYIYKKERKNRSSEGSIEGFPGTRHNVHRQLEQME